MKVQEYLVELLNDFKEANPTAQVIAYEVGDINEGLITPNGIWLKVFTANLGWLHVYHDEKREVIWY